MSIKNPHKPLFHILPLLFLLMGERLLQGQEPGAAGALESLGMASTRERRAGMEPDPNEGFTLSLRAIAHPSEGRRTLRFGDPVYSRERMELFVTLNRPAYLYVVQFFPDGTSAELFPRQEDIRLSAGQEQRVPNIGQWLELDDSTGEENLYVVASMLPIRDADLVVARQLSQIRVSAKNYAKSSARARLSQPGRSALPGKAVAEGTGRPALASVPPSGSVELSWRTKAVNLIGDGSMQDLRTESRRREMAIFRLMLRHLSAAAP